MVCQYSPIKDVQTRFGGLMTLQVLLEGRQFRAVSGFEVQEGLGSLPALTSLSSCLCWSPKGLFVPLEKWQSWN